MTMDNRRFGGGLAAGILLGVVVIAASGVLQVPLFAGSFNAAAATTTTVLTSTTFASTSSATNTQYTSVPGQPNSTSTQSAMNYTGTKSVSAATNMASISGLLSALTPLPSSSFAALSTQGAGSNAFLLIPIAVALILGVVIYRANLRNRESPEDDDGIAT